MLLEQWKRKTTGLDAIANLPMSTTPKFKNIILVFNFKPNLIRQHRLKLEQQYNKNITNNKSNKIVENFMFCIFKKIYSTNEKQDSNNFNILNTDNCFLFIKQGHNKSKDGHIFSTYLLEKQRKKYAILRLPLMLYCSTSLLHICI